MLTVAWPPKQAIGFTIVATAVNAVGCIIVIVVVSEHP